MLACGMRNAMRFRPARMWHWAVQRWSMPPDKWPQMNDRLQQDAPTIVVQDLTKLFGRFVAVDHLTFSIGKGEIFGFLGPNGAGKSTTIRMLCGLLSSTSGTANGRRFRHQQGTGAGSPEYRLRIPEVQPLQGSHSLGKHKLLWSRVYGLEARACRRELRLSYPWQGLSGLENRLTGTFVRRPSASGLALGCGILHEPPILFLDEPTSGVDPISRRMFWDLIQNMSATGVTSWSPHTSWTKREFCDRIGFISAGKLVALNTPGAIKQQAVEDDLFEVALPPFAGRGRKLTVLMAVSASSYLGQRLHVFCHRGAHTEQSLRTALGSRGSTCWTSNALG